MYNRPSSVQELLSELTKTAVLDFDTLTTALYDFDLRYVFDIRYVHQGSIFNCTDEIFERSFNINVTKAKSHLISNTDRYFMIFNCFSINLDQVRSMFWMCQTIAPLIPDGGHISSRYQIRSNFEVSDYLKGQVISSTCLLWPPQSRVLRKGVIHDGWGIHIQKIWISQILHAPKLGLHNLGTFTSTNLEFDQNDGFG